MHKVQNVLRDLPQDAEKRKQCPIATGLLDYFPLAAAEIARVSKAGNDQHNPGQPLHWARGKSADHADCIVRHLIQRGTVDTDGQRHTGKMAWRALALLQEELEAEAGFTPAPEPATSPFIISGGSLLCSSGVAAINGLPGGVRIVGSSGTLQTVPTDKAA